MIDKQGVALRIFELRNKNNLSQRVFAKSIEISQQTLSQVENGEIMPSIKVLHQITSKYSIDYSYLLEGEKKELDLTAFKISSEDLKNEAPSVDINNRVFEIINYKEITESQLAEKLNMKTPDVSAWRSGDKIPLLTISKINSLFPDINFHWLLTGEGEIIKSTKTESESSKLENKEVIPLIPISAMAGYANGDSSVMRYEIEDDYTVPEFLGKGVRFLIRVSGSSMLPKYSNGDILACRPITDLTFFQWGKVYVLDTDQGPIVKRLFPCDEDVDSVECHSENNDSYPPFKIKKSSIRNVSIVIGVIRLE